MAQIGRCIYCGETAGRLSDEHAIPYGLNGNLILRNASCQKHANITSAYEMSCLRGLLGRARARLNLKTRRPKTVSTVFEIDHGFGWEKAQADARHFAGMNLLPWFKPPSILRGERIVDEIKLRGWDHLALGDAIPHPASIAKGGTVTVKLTAELDVWAFTRMLAKIGYCCAVAHLGLESIAEAFVLPLVRNESNDAQTWVGSEDLLFNPPSNALHTVEVFVKGEMIVAIVCLFAAFGGKPYTVVV